MSDIAKIKAEKVRKRKALELDRHKELIQANLDILTALEDLKTVLGEEETPDYSPITSAISQLKESFDFGPYAKNLEQSIKSLAEKLKVNVEAPDLSEIITAIKENKAEPQDLNPVTQAIEELSIKIDSKKVKQDPNDYVPYRRVIKVGKKLIFDDTPTPYAIGGGGGGITARVWNGSEYTNEYLPLSVVESTEQPGLYALVVANYDGSPITGGGVAAETFYRVSDSGDIRVTDSGDIRVHAT